MTVFRSKSIDQNRTLAEMLADARVRKGVTIEEASRALGIQSHHLKAFEDGHLDALPGEVYARKYLERYARYLDVPVADVRERLEQSLTSGLWTKTPQEIKVKREHLMVWPRRIRLIAAAAAIVALAGYFAGELFVRSQPPPLALDYPFDGLVTHLEALTVSGKTEPETRLTVNGAAVPVGADGRFSLSLNLSDGINYIRVSAARRLGRQRMVEVKVVRE